MTSPSEPDDAENPTPESTPPADSTHSPTEPSPQLPDSSNVLPASPVDPAASAIPSVSSTEVPASGPMESMASNEASESPDNKAVQASESTGVGGATEAGGAVDDGLPEWEPLTPELVEDEAIRGDFVIRWAVVGLALLFGFSQIEDTRTLVHIRSGEYMAAHGFLPPSTDVFSSTATGRRWVNLSWLFDLCVSGVHAVAGGIGLTIVQAILAGIAFGLLAHTYRPGIRTWWGSICVTLALLACSQQITVQPELITLAGMACLLWIVVHAEAKSCDRTLWLSVPLLWLWSQFDQRAFLGWLLLIVLAAGMSIRRTDISPSPRVWWRVALIGLAVVAIHPFLWESWLSPVRLFGTDYPALRQIFSRPFRHEAAFYPITDLSLPYFLRLDSIAALILFLATIVTLVLNRERLNPGYVFAFCVFNGIALLAAHEWAAASLVNCVISTVNAQMWYRQRFGQVYSIDWRELLFSRGGRAVTVFCLFGLAWTVISGRIDGPSGKRTGIGFTDDLLVQTDCYQRIAANSFDDHPFHFSGRQGDLLIWSGQKSFIDTRAGLFAGHGQNDLLALHHRTRQAIRATHLPSDLQPKTGEQPVDSRSGSSEPDVWKETFAKYQITHVIPRLSGPVPLPDYITFVDLISSDEWVLTDLSAAAAVFYRKSSEGPLADYVNAHRMDSVTSAFRTPSVKPDDPKPESQREVARPATTYDNIFSLRQPKHPAGVQEAAHLLQLSGLKDATLSQKAARALLAVRRAVAGLREDPNSVEGYRMLGMAYLRLDRIETEIMQTAGIRWLNATRYFQAITAIQQASLLKPDDLSLHSDLLVLFMKMERRELALTAIQQMKRLRPANVSQEERPKWEQLVNEEFALLETVERIEDGVNQQLQNGADRFQVAAIANQAGAVKTAIRVMEEEAVYKERNPAAKCALGAWLLEAGRIQDGLETLEAVEQSSAVEGGPPGWRDSVATGLLVVGDYLHAIRLWSDQLQEDASAGATGVVITLPFQQMNPLSDQYPISHIAAVAEVVGRFRADSDSLLLKCAMAQLEMGDDAAAAKSLQRLLERNPQTAMFPLVKFYLENLTNGQIEAPAKPNVKIEEFESIGEESPAKTDDSTDAKGKPETSNKEKPVLPATETEKAPK